MTQEELQHKICVLLGGRAAEKLMLGHLSTGAADDLAKATQIAREMVMRYGMNEELGCVSHDSNRTPGTTDLTWGAPPEPLSEATRQKIDAAITALLAHNLQRASAILSRNQALLTHSVHALLNAETLDEQALKILTRDLEKEPLAV